MNADILVLSFFLISTFIRPLNYVFYHNSYVFSFAFFSKPGDESFVLSMAMFEILQLHLFINGAFVLCNGDKPAIKYYNCLYFVFSVFTCVYINFLYYDQSKSYYLPFTEEYYKPEALLCIAKYIIGVVYFFHYF